MLADLIHHVRAELNYAQIKKTIIVYADNLLDGTLSSSIQTMSAKLLLNMIDRIMKLPNQADGHQVLMLILMCFSRKISALNSALISSENGTVVEPDFCTLTRQHGIHLALQTSETDVDALKGLSIFLMSRMPR